MSTTKNAPRVIVVGGGLGGLWATLRIAEAGFPVDLFSLFEVKRSHSVCAQGGINACLDTKGEHDCVWQHIVDTIKGGAYLANQPPVKSMCDDAPGLIRTFERMGVTFSRTPEGLLDLRLFGGVKNRRTCFAGASTGQQLLYGVDQQVRRLEDQGRSSSTSGGSSCPWSWMRTGPPAASSPWTCAASRCAPSAPTRSSWPPAGWARSTAARPPSTNSTGAAASRVYQQGAWIANVEFFQFHPTAMLGDDKNRLMSEAARGEGGRVWVPRTPGTPARPAASPRRSASTSSKSGSRPTATPCRETWPPGPSGASLGTWGWG